METILEPGKSVGQDCNLVARARGGDRAAFDELFVTHRAFIYNVCRRMLGSQEDAVDATQNTFICAYRAIGKFRGEASFRSWLCRIAINESSAILRRSKKPAETQTPDEPERGETRDRVWESILDLPADARSVLVLFYFQQMSCDEVAESLGCSVGAVRVRLHRAREAFKRRYTEKER
jgi:RNA polymerase sigma-70 factor (ECF subfamily)